MNKKQREGSIRGTALSVLLHGAILAALLFSWHSVNKNESAGGDAGIEADLVKFGDLPSDMQSAITGAPQPAPGEPLPSPVETPEAVNQPEVAPPAEQDPLPEQVETDPVPTPVLKPEPKPVPVKATPPKPAITKTAATKPVEAKPVKTPPEKPVEKKTAEKPVTQPTGAAKARADALAKMRAEQLKDINGGGKATTSGNPKGASNTGTKSSVGKGDASGSSTGNQKRWLDAVAKAIERQWLRPDGIPKDEACPIRIRIIPGGEVISANVQAGCPYSEAAKRSVQDAVMKASPLPFKGFENDYARDFTVNFYPSK